MRITIATLLAITALLSAQRLGVAAQGAQNILTLDNQSGELALVKVVGPASQTVEVASSSAATVNVAAGEYYLLVRYGSKPTSYSYSRGDRFLIQETSTQRSATTITLHKVVAGNYGSRTSSGKEFEQALSSNPSLVKSAPAAGTSATLLARFRSVKLLLKPSLADQAVLNTVGFGARLSVLNRQQDWVFVRPPNGPPGWVHELAVTDQQAEIDAIFKAKQVPDLVLHLNFDTGPFLVIAGSADGALSKLDPGAVIYVAAVGRIPESAFLNGTFDGVAKVGTLYFLTPSLKWVTWNHRK